jgi:transcriptional regulator with XRE-family HTH domain
MTSRGHGGAVLEPIQQPTEGPWALAELEGLSVGGRIKALRDDRRWSAQKLADDCATAGTPSLTRSALAKVENGLRRLRTDEAVALSQILDVPLGYLLGAEADEPDPVAESAERLASGDDGRALAFPAAPASDVVRRSELDWLINSLSNVGGPHFWLVTGPPGIGKTTMLAQLGEEIARDVPGWESNLVDLDLQPPDVRQNATALLARLFSFDAAQLDETALHRAIAQWLSRDGRRFLCLLDNAEELSPRTARLLRSSLSEVCRLVELTGNPDVRVGFIVASSLDDGWLGATAPLRLSVLPLSEFGADVVEERLRTWATRADRQPGEPFSRTAGLVHRVTAGLPALLHPVLGWIRDEEWLDLYRLESPEVFESLVRPYIEDRLLAADSLFPRDGNVPQEHAALVQNAIQYLVRYRFFTLSHVQRFLDADEESPHRLERSGWRVEDLWSALGGSTLLARPLDEPWQTIHPAIRRLLFQYFYPSAEQRAEAHREATGFMSAWAASQSGTDQVVGLIEALWQTTGKFRRTRQRSAELREELLKKAAEFGAGVTASMAFSTYELREYAVARINADVELQESMADVDGLLDELIEVLKGRE